MIVGFDSRASQRTRFWALRPLRLTQANLNPIHRSNLGHPADHRSTLPRSNASPPARAPLEGAQDLLRYPRSHTLVSLSQRRDLLKFVPNSFQRIPQHKRKREASSSLSLGLNTSQTSNLECFRQIFGKGVIVKRRSLYFNILQNWLLRLGSV